MRYTFPHYTPNPEFIQPDYDKWNAVEIGMARDDVVALLGPPHDDEFCGHMTRADAPYFCYGYLQMPMLPHPRTYDFLIGFDDDGKVWTKIDPFKGKFSTDGSPTAPEIIIPLDHSEFSHFPRVLDFRWYPCSGVYPMTYTVESGMGVPSGSQCFFDEEIETELQIPFFMETFVGAQPGRFRVKARNEVGEGDWSEYRYFEFTV